MDAGHADLIFMRLREPRYRRNQATKSDATFDTIYDTVDDSIFAKRKCFQCGTIEIFIVALTLSPIVFVIGAVRLYLLHKSIGGPTKHSK